MSVTDSLRALFADAIADERKAAEAIERTNAEQAARRERQALARELDAAEYAHRCAIDAAEAADRTGDELAAILAHRRVAATADHITDIKTALKGATK